MTLIEQFDDIKPDTYYVIRYSDGTEHYYKTSNHMYEYADGTKAFIDITNIHSGTTLTVYQAQVNKYINSKRLTFYEFDPNEYPEYLV